MLILNAGIAVIVICSQYLQCFHKNFYIWTISGILWMFVYMLYLYILHAKMICNRY